MICKVFDIATPVFKVDVVIALPSTLIVPFVMF